MNSLVIYGSRYGNTRRIADAIAAELGQHGDVHLVAAEEVNEEVRHDHPALVAVEAEPGRHIRVLPHRRSAARSVVAVGGPELAQRAAGVHEHPAVALQPLHDEALAAEQPGAEALVERDPE